MTNHLKSIRVRNKSVGHPQPCQAMVLMIVVVGFLCPSSLAAQNTTTDHAATKPAIDGLIIRTSDPQTAGSKTVETKAAKSTTTTLKPAIVDPYDELEQMAAPYSRFNKLVKAVIKLCRPTVVHIEARKSIKKSNGALARIEEAGAGVIFEHRNRFFVITNRHVIADAKLSAIQIQTSDGRFFNPVDIRTDRDTDIAVMYLDEKKLSASRFGDSSELDLGDFVIAIGSPFGLNHSISTGIISGKGRRDLDLGANGVRLQDFLQTDAAINPGNSGGPLLNMQGEVIGINTAIASNSGHNEGIGFAIPINMVEQVARDLIDYGKVRRGFLGVSLDSKYSPDKARQIGLNSLFGARVTSITPGSPADFVDLQIGDVILKYNGRAIENDSHLVNEVNLTKIGSKVSVEYFREGERKSVTVTIQDRSQINTNQ